MAPETPGAVTLGIDLASQAENTAVCLLLWREDRAEVAYLERGRDARGALDDQRLLELMLGGVGPGCESTGTPTPARIGIDAPLGWPAAFVSAVRDLDAWPSVEEVEPAALVRRATDRWIHAQTGKLPLSVSTDRIAYPAMRAARLLRRYREVTGAAIDRSGMSGHISEVYPDTAITRFGLRPAGMGRASYKGAAGRPVRQQMLVALRRAAPWLVLTTGQHRACISTDDHFDALIAALVTRAVALGLTHPPPVGMAADAASEGWIQLPVVGALEALKPSAA